MAFKVAGRGQVPPFIVMDVMRAAARRAAEGGDVLHLEVGQPGGGAPPPVIAAVKRAMDEADLGYTLAQGIDPLRRRIARFYGEEHGIDLDPERVVATTGSSGAFLLAFLACFEPGDRVGMASPGYPAYRNILTALGVTPVLLPVGPETRFQPSARMIAAIDPPLDGLIVASPSNPTGSMLEDAEFEALAKLCDARGIRLVSDEIYHGIAYGRRAKTALHWSRHGVLVNSFSKYFAMTGWRLGWLVIPEELHRAVECLAQNLFISPPTLSQYAGLAAFECRDALDAYVARYAKNREILLRELPKAGFTDLAPSDGAFYLYADIGHMTNDSPEFCRRMLAETGVAATPGIDFDPDRGHRTMRFSFAGTTETMVEAARRLIAWRK